MEEDRDAAWRLQLEEIFSSEQMELFNLTYPLPPERANGIVQFLQAIFDTDRESDSDSVLRQDQKEDESSEEMVKNSAVQVASETKEASTSTRNSTSLDANETGLPTGGETGLTRGGETGGAMGGAAALPTSGATALPTSGATALPTSGATALPTSGATALPTSGATGLVMGTEKGGAGGQTGGPQNEAAFGSRNAAPGGPLIGAACEPSSGAPGGPVSGAACESSSGAPGGTVSGAAYGKSSGAPGGPVSGAPGGPMSAAADGPTTRVVGGPTAAAAGGPTVGAAGGPAVGAVGGPTVGAASGSVVGVTCGSANRGTGEIQTIRATGGAVVATTGGARGGESVSTSSSDACLVAGASPKSPTSSENVRRSPAAKERNQSTSSESKSASPSSAGPGSAKKKSPGVRRPPPREPSMVELLMMLGGPTLSVAEANSIAQDVERDEQGWRQVMAADLHSQGLSVPSHLRPMGGNCHRGHERTPREPASGADQAGAPVSQETKPAETVNVDPDTGITCTTSTQGAAATVDEKKSVPEKSPQILKQPASSEKVESPKQPARSENAESPKQPASSENAESPKQPASSEKADSQTTREGNQSTSSESKSASPSSAGPGSAKKKSPGVRRPPPREPSMVELLMRLGGPTLSAAEANSIVQDVEREEQGWRQVMAADLHSQGMSVPCHLRPMGGTCHRRHERGVVQTPRDPASGADQAGAPVSQETKPAETVNVDPDTGITCTTSTQGAAATVDEKKSLPEGSSKSPKPPSNSEKTSPKPPASSEKVSPKPPASSEKTSPKPPASSEKVSPKPPASSDKVSPKPPASSETASPKQPGSSEKAQSQTSSVGKQTTTGKSKSASPGSAKTSSPSPRRPPQREQSIAEMLMEYAIPRMSAEEARNAERKMAMTEERMRRGLMAGELHSQALTALWHLNPTGETIHFGNEMVVFERPQNPAGQTDRPVKQETKTAETASVKPDSGTTSTSMAQDQDQPPSVIDDENTSSEKSPERPSRPVFHDDQTGSDDIRSTNEQEASDKAKQDTKAKAKKADKDKKALTRKPETSAAPSTSETTRDAGSQEQPPELAARLLMWELDQRNQASRIRAMEIIREFNDAFNPLFTTTAVSERTDESMSSEGETFGQRGRDERPGPSRVLGATAEPPPDTPRQDIFAIESLLELFRTPWRSEVMRKYTGRQLAELRMRLIARRCALLAAQSAREMRSSGLDLVARTFRLMAGPLNVENCDGDGRCRHAEIPHEANRHAGRPCDPHRPHRGADVSGSDAGRRYANASLDFLNNERTLRSMIMEIESEIYARGNVASSHAMAMSIPLEEVTRNLIQLTYEAPSEPPVCLLLPFGQGNPDMNAFVQTLTRARARCNFPPQGLTQSQINDLPTVLYNGASGQVEASSASRCSICLHDYQIGDEIRILPCGHEFHKTCVDEWLKKAPTCPICRERIRRNV